VESKTLSVVHLDDNEAAFSLAVVPFSARGGELHLVVGTAADTLISPRSCTSGYLRTYKFTDDGAGLEFQHKTEVDDVPLALLAFQGRLVAGVGKALRIYDIGKKKLLRKVENKVIIDHQSDSSDLTVYPSDFHNCHCVFGHARFAHHCRGYARIYSVRSIQSA